MLKTVVSMLQKMNQSCFHLIDFGICISSDACSLCVTKGTTINDLGVGPEEIEEKKFRGPSSGKNKSQKAFQKKIILTRHSRGKNKSIFDFSSGPPPDH